MRADHSITRTEYAPGVVMGCSVALQLICIDSMADNESPQTNVPDGGKDGEGNGTNPQSVTVTVQVVWPNRP
jgi:hypothetical protein